MLFLLFVGEPRGQRILELAFQYLARRGTALPTSGVELGAVRFAYRVIMSWTFAIVTT